MRWPLISYTDNLPDGVAGDARGPFIRIRKGYEADEGLYQHELRHVKQWAIVGLLLGLINAVIAWVLAPLGPLSQFQVAAVIGGAAFVASHGFLYLFVRTYRETAEADAYRTQTQFPNGKGGQLTLDNAAYRLSLPNYKLNITIDQARELLAS